MATLKDLLVSGPARVIGNITGKSFIKEGGTSSQFLKADGSVDSNSYSTTSHNHSGVYKPVQTAVSDPTASSTTSTTFIDSISQNANGVITATKKTLPSYASSSHTHTTTIATSTGTNQITLEHGGKYSITAGGTSYVFTMPSQYTHPSGAGSKHIPYGGSSGQFLGWTANGAAAWVDNPNTDHSVDQIDFTDSSLWHGIMLSHENITDIDFGNNTLRNFNGEVGFSNKIFLNPSSGAIVSMGGYYDANGNSVSYEGHTHDYSASNHTHTTTIATSTGTNQITLAFGTKYAITAGGTSYVFTMPSNPNTNTTYTIATGDSNGQIKVTPSSGSAYNVSVKGLGSAAYTASTDYATSGHTHTTSIATSSGTNQITLAFGTKYAITAGGTSYVFTMPSNPNTDHYDWSDITNKPSSYKPSSHNHSLIITEGDNRSVQTKPNDYANKLIFRGLKNNSTIGINDGVTYSYLIGLRGWSDSSGGNAHELAFDNKGIWWRTGETTTWNGGNQKFERILSTADVGSSVATADHTHSGYAASNHTHSGYKTTQTAVSDPTASSTTSTTFIDSISQNANGVITATKKTLPAYAAANHTHSGYLTSSSSLNAANLTGTIPSSCYTDNNNFGTVLVETAGGDAAKVGIVDFPYALNKGNCFILYLKQDNTVKNATLNIKDTGAKDVYLDGAKVTASNWKAGTYLFYYDGARYHTSSRNPFGDTNTTYTITTGDSNGQIKVTPSSGDAYNVNVKGLGSAAYTASTAYAASSHSHGSITSDGKISSGTALANGDAIVFSDSSDSSKLKKSTITFDGSTTTKFLSQKGTWETPSGGGGGSTVVGKTVELSTTNQALITVNGSNSGNVKLPDDCPWNDVVPLIADSANHHDRIGGVTPIFRADTPKVEINGNVGDFSDIQDVSGVDTKFLFPQVGKSHTLYALPVVMDNHGRLFILVSEALAKDVFLGRSMSTDAGDLRGK